MPRPILRNQQNVSNNILSATLATESQQISTPQEKMQAAKLLRQKRSKRYIEILHSLDAGGHAMNRSEVEAIVNEIRQEFPEVKLDSILLGIISICYLGAPYEVHSLDLQGQIIYHYKVNEPMPERMETARGLAIHGGYEYIEVYDDCLRAVDGSGNVSVINR